MRFTPTITPAPATPTTRAVKGLVDVHATKAVHPSEAELPQTEGSVGHAGGRSPRAEVHLPFEDRRKACRRIHHQKVLIELRSGLDRRRHNLLAGGVVDHIDEEV
jgi:hypothetical protein